MIFLKNFFKEDRVKMLIAILFIILGIILFKLGNGTAFFVSKLDYVLLPVQEFCSYVSNSAENIFYGGKVVELQNEKQVLEEEVRKLRELTIDYYKIKEENVKLLKCLSIKEQNKSLRFAYGYVIGRDPTDDYGGFVLDIGSTSGIEVGMPVITENGLVGCVDSVSNTSCKVNSILSPDVKVGAKDVVTSDIGVVMGSSYFTAEGKTKFTYLTAHNSMTAGNIVVTSGISDMFPRDIPIGTVDVLGYDIEDGVYYATVKPFEDVKNIKSAFVIVDFQGRR